jgi:hypothetical protein
MTKVYIHNKAIKFGQVKKVKNRKSKYFRTLLFFERPPSAFFYCKLAGCDNMLHILTPSSIVNVNNLLATLS